MLKQLKMVWIKNLRRLFKLLPSSSVIYLWILSVAIGLLRPILALTNRFLLRTQKRKKPVIDHGEPYVLTSLHRAIKDRKKLPKDLPKHIGNSLYAAGVYLLTAGRLNSSRACIDLSLKATPLISGDAANRYRTLGAIYFMQGELADAHRAFRSAGMMRRVLISSGRVSNKIRQLSGSWFVAYGHIAMLDFYFKKRDLGWSQDATHVFAFVDLSHPKTIGKVLLQQFGKKGITFLKHGTKEAERYYGLNKFKNEPVLNLQALSSDDHAALTDEFWEYDFSDGEILTYTHGAAKIQQQWESENRTPLMTLDDMQQKTAQILLEKMGVPLDAWFVCLHVREGGYHAKWNKAYPSARDANIADYYLAIKAVTDLGGWVIRMGDASMTPLPEMERVFDYAHSILKCEIGDIVLPVKSKFLIGTNSGYATVPGIYGVPNVLTNWTPIALPLWFGCDLMIPKLFWHKEENRHLTFEELFATKIGAMQNINEFPDYLEIRSNTPEEIVEATLEMLDRTRLNLDYSESDDQLQDRYFDLAIRHGSYKGSRIGRDFLRRYSHLLPQQE